MKKLMMLSFWAYNNFFLFSFPMLYELEKQKLKIKQPTDSIKMKIFKIKWKYSNIVYIPHDWFHKYFVIMSWNDSKWE